VGCEARWGVGRAEGLSDGGKVARVGPSAGGKVV